MILTFMKLGPGVDYFCAILEQSINNKMVRKFRSECPVLISVYTNGNFMFICKPMNDGRWRLRKQKQKQKQKKQLLLSSSHFVFIGKIVTTYWTPWVVWKLSFSCYSITCAKQLKYKLFLILHSVATHKTWFIHLPLNIMTFSSENKQSF